MHPFPRRLPTLLLAFLATLGPLPAQARKQYDPGASDREIRIGTLVPSTGPFAEYGATGRAIAAYFRMVNDHGGINGRKVTFLSVDSGPDFQAVQEQARDLVEREQVLLFAGTWGSRANRAIRPYLNRVQVPQLFYAANDSDLEDPEHFPWTLGFAPSKRAEANQYARYLLDHRPAAKIAVLASADETGDEFVAGLRQGLGGRAGTMIVGEARFSYAAQDQVPDRVAELKRTGADVFMNFAVGRAASRGIRAAADQDWHPLQFIPNASLSIAAFLEPAGLEQARGLVCNARSKGWTTAAERRDPAVRAFLAWMREYNPGASLQDAQYVYGYETAQTLEEVLRRCGDELTRTNVLRQATHLDLDLDMLRPGIRIHTGPADYQPIKGMFLIRFDGREWEPL